MEAGITWDAALREIVFPAALQLIVDGMRALNASELAGLNVLGDADGKDAGSEIAATLGAHRFVGAV
jgi:hypothetical protein